jgi:DNA-directed RNA polymerase specialized sigma24 family protein
VNHKSEDETQWAALLERAARRDVDAFDAFYLCSAPWALALARQLVGDGIAEEFLARLYVQAWEEAVTFHCAGAAAQDWLRALARRLAARQ